MIAVSALVVSTGLSVGGTEAAAQSSAGAISGRVTGPGGAPLEPGVRICVAVGQAHPGVEVAEDGTYVVGNLAPRRYSVAFRHCGGPARYAPEFYPNIHDHAASGWSSMPNVPVVAGTTRSGIDAELELGGELTLSLVDRTGTPRSGLCVSVDPSTSHSNGNLYTGGIRTTKSGVTDGDGRLHLSGMGPADYVVMVWPCHSGRTPTELDLPRIQYSGGVFTRAEATTTRIELGDSAELAMTLAPAATVSGRVTFEGAPVVGRCMMFVTDNDAGGPGWEGPQTLTDDNGEYLIRGITPVAPGRLLACGERNEKIGYDHVGLIAPKWYPSAATRWTAASLSLVPGADRAVDFELERERTLSMIAYSIPSASTSAVMVHDAARLRRVDLRPTTRSDVRVGDIFGVAYPIAESWLECDGRRVATGMNAEADERTPMFLPGVTENERWQVYAYEYGYDRTGPTITGSIAPERMTWTRGWVDVSFTCADPAGVASCPAPARFHEGTVRTLTATDRRGNRTTQTFGPYRVDNTPPRTSVRNPQRTFALSERIDLGCAIRDERSGLADHVIQCPRAGTPASSLGAGTHRFAIAGHDRAGNTVWDVVTIEIVK